MKIFGPWKKDSIHYGWYVREQIYPQSPESRCYYMIRRQNHGHKWVWGIGIPEYDTKEEAMKALDEVIISYGYRFIDDMERMERLEVLL